MTCVNKKCFQLNLGWKRTSRKHFSASAFISRSRPSASTSKMALASKTFSLMSFFNLGFNWKNFSFTLVPFFLTVFYNNFDNKILFTNHYTCLMDVNTIFIKFFGKGLYFHIATIKKELEFSIMKSFWCNVLQISGYANKQDWIPFSPTFFL